MSEIVDYWEMLKSSVNTEEPIYKWECFRSDAEIQKSIDQITKVLRTFNYSNPYLIPERRAFSCLFLIRCALLCRLGNDWDLERNDQFFEGIGQPYFDRNSDWRGCITAAERILRRAPLMRYNIKLDNERTARKYCARVLVEAGLPLNSLQGHDGCFSKVENGLRNIYNLYSQTTSEIAYERQIREFMASGNLYDATGQSFWLPGGYAGCRNFFSIGLELLESIDGQNTNQIMQSLVEQGFKSPTNESIEYIFGLRNYSQNKRALSIRRYLRWEDDIYETYAFIEYEPAVNLPETHSLELKIANQPVARWTYAGNGAINEERGRHTCDKNVFSSAVLKKDANQIEVLGEVDLSNPIFFKHSSEELYEWVAEPSFKTTDFPICAIFPNGYIEDHALNLSNIAATNLSLENGTENYQVYKFVDEDQLNRAGLSFANTHLVLVPPQKVFTANFIDSTGRKYRNPTQTTEYPRAPLRNMKSIVLSSEDRKNWADNSTVVDENDFHFAYYKLDSAAATDPGSGILILPREFDYTFIPDPSTDNSFAGIQFQYKNDEGEIKNIENVEVFIDSPSQPATRSDWESLKHNSIIRCIIKNSRNEQLDLIIPSPIIGASWFFTSNDNPDQSSNKQASATNYRTRVKLNCVQQSADRFDVLYKIKLIDNDQTLLEFTDCLIPQLNRSNNYFLDLPSYLDKLFSATNSLNAKMHVVAEVRNSSGIPTETDTLELTRFDESAYEGHFFCIGLLYQKVLDLDRMPTEEECRQELWLKVPAYLSSTGDAKWNHHNRIRLINNFITETATLNDFQKLLLGNDYLQVQSQIRLYFDNHCQDLDDDVIQLIERCFDLCVKYDIPICNLWALQATIQDDRIFVQIPNIYKFKHLLNENTFLCSFDWQLIRPSALKFAKDNDIKKLIRKQIESEDDEGNEPIGSLSDVDGIDFDYVISGIPEPPLVDEDDDLTSWESDAFKEALARDKINCCTDLSNYELLLYFIVRQVVYGDNKYYQARLNWATLCLKYLKCINASKTRQLVKKIRKEIKNIYKVNQHQAGFSNIVWNEWKSGKFEDPVPCDRISDKDPYTQGQNDAINSFPERYWLELLKKFTCNSDSKRFYFNLYRYPYPSLDKDTMENKAHNLEIKYNQYKLFFEQGWNSLGSTDAIQYCCYLPHLDNIAVSDIPHKATIIGNIAHSWFIEWPKIVDSFNVGDKLKGNIKKMIPIHLLDLTKDEQELARQKTEDLNSLSEKIQNALNQEQLRPNAQYLHNAAGLEASVIAADIFGDYKAHYYLYRYYERLGKKKQASLEKDLAEKFLDPQIFLYSAQVCTNNNPNGNNFETIQMHLEKAASLGNKDALVKLANRSKSMLESFNSRFRKEYDEQLRRNHHQSSEIDFRGKLDEYFSLTIGFEKKTIHYYKTASRLGNAEACFKYYNEISELKGDGTIRPLINKVLGLIRNRLDSELSNDESYIQLVENLITNLKNDIRRVERHKYIFDKWCRLNNEWVYLRRAALKGKSLLEAKDTWQAQKTFHEKTVRDPRDGKEYIAVKLGNTWWLAENLQYEALSTKQSNGKHYYTNDAAQEAAFDGWRLPTVEDFKKLTEWSARHGIRKDPVGVSLKSESWKSDNPAKGVLTGTDDFGFAATPSGLMIEEHDGILRNDEAFYWTSSKNTDNIPYCANLSSSHNELGITTMSKDYCLSVRLVCDSDPLV